MTTAQEGKRMRQKRWMWILVLCALMLSVAAASIAQQPAQPSADEASAQAIEDIQLTRMEILLARQTLITQGMDLTPEEMRPFWLVYRDYRREAVKIGDRFVALITQYAANYDQLTDGVADKLLAEFMSIEQARARLRAKYVPKFKKVLSPKKVARFYQLENKLDLIVLSEVAEQIPLAR